MSGGNERGLAESHDRLGKKERKENRKKKLKKDRKERWGKIAKEIKCYVVKKPPT